MYSGIIFPDSESETGLAGEMVDIFGESILSDVKVGEHEVFFTKRYVNRTDTMAYQFHREGNLWVGGYSGSAVCNGGAKCIITDVPNDFFLPPK
ncbi:MAG: hypothetical protein Q7T51_02340 [Candidatus Moranbacteria bacterium]|nr:hypothetical protein [Candidatus Moranbacteria bacterium]